MDIKDRKEPNFASIEDMLSLARDTAEADYRNYLKALRTASTSDERESLTQDIERSIVASRQLASAQEYFIKSREMSKSATVDLLKGNHFAADSNFKTSGAQMQQAAEGLARFSDYVPKSRMMAAAINFVAKRDEMISKAGASLDGSLAAAELKVVRTAESFSRGMKSFAESMHSFGTKLANAPDQIREIARATSVSVYEATTGFAMDLMSKFKQKLNSVRNAVGDSLEKVDRSISSKASAAADAVKDGRDATKIFATSKLEQAKENVIRGRDAAWDAVDRLGNASVKLATDVKDTSVRALEATDRGLHGVTAVAKAPVVVATAILKSLGAAVSESYHDGVEARAETQQKRKMRQP